MLPLLARLPILRNPRVLRALESNDRCGLHRSLWQLRYGTTAETAPSAAWGHRVQRLSCYVSRIGANFSMAGRHAGWPTSKISSSSTSPGHATVNILPYLGVQSIAM